MIALDIVMGDWLSILTELISQSPSRVAGFSLHLGVSAGIHSFHHLLCDGPHGPGHVLQVALVQQLLGQVLLPLDLALGGFGHVWDCVGNEELDRVDDVLEGRREPSGAGWAGGTAARGSASPGEHKRHTGTPRQAPRSAKARHIYLGNFKFLTKVNVFKNI